MCLVKLYHRGVAVMVAARGWKGPWFEFTVDKKVQIVKI